MFNRIFLMMNTCFRIPWDILGAILGFFSRLPYHFLKIIAGNTDTSNVHEWPGVGKLPFMK